MKKRMPLFSLAFLAFNALILLGRDLPGLARGNFSFGLESHTLTQWCQFLGDGLIYYSMAVAFYLLLCNFHPQKKYAHIVALTAIICIVTFFIGLYWTRLFADSSHIRLSRYFKMVVVTIGIQLFFALVFYLSRYAQYTEMQQLELKLQNRKAELSFLRSQINPHFLFNNLNTIYTLMYEHNPQALSAMAELCDLLRYMLYDNSETVSLKKELGYIERYIALQQLRYESPSCIEIKQNCSDDNMNIPPLLLIPFVENAFKHGKASTTDYWLKLEIESNSSSLNFKCSNQVGEKRKDTTSGIGLENVRQRLHLLYPDRHKLEIIEHKNWFTVTLQLQYGK